MEINKEGYEELVGRLIYLILNKGKGSEIIRLSIEIQEYRSTVNELTM
jgi:hypothetical protein